MNSINVTSMIDESKFNKFHGLYYFGVHSLLYLMGMIWLFMDRLPSLWKNGL